MGGIISSERDREGLKSSWVDLSLGFLRDCKEQGGMKELMNELSGRNYKF